VLALKKTDREGKGGGLVRGGDGFSLSLLLVSLRFSSLLLFSCSILLGKKMRHGFLKDLQTGFKT
jgi:hypothetical protein